MAKCITLPQNHNVSYPEGKIRFILHVTGFFLGIFEECHEVVPPEPFFESCVFDMCATDGEVVALCQAIESYADMCAANGINIKWRTSTFCRKSTLTNVWLLLFFFIFESFITFWPAISIRISLCFVSYFCNVM